MLPSFSLKKSLTNLVGHGILKLNAAKNILLGLMTNFIRYNHKLYLTMIFSLFVIKNLKMLLIRRVFQLEKLYLLENHFLRHQSSMHWFSAID